MMAGVRSMVSGWLFRKKKRRQQETEEQVQKDAIPQGIKRGGWQQEDRSGETERLQMSTEREAEGAVDCH